VRGLFGRLPDTFPITIVYLSLSRALRGSHAFWNAESETVRFLELITPGGFEEYFFELAGRLNARDLETMGTIRVRYRLTVKPESVPELLERYALTPSF
jgi:hypothetical protein